MMRWVYQQLKLFRSWFQRLFRRKRKKYSLRSPSALVPQNTIQQNSQGDKNQLIHEVSDGNVIGRIKAKNIYFNNKNYYDSESSRKLDQKNHSDQVQQGLNVLTALMQRSPEVQESVNQFRSAFEKACNEINIISDYKILHDCLHTLEFQYYDRILQDLREIERFPENDANWNYLIKYRQILNDHLIRIEAVKSNELLTYLQDAQTTLHTAIQKKNLELLQRNVRFLKRILATQPSRINTRLVTFTHSLYSNQLPDLVKAIESIVEKLVSSGLSMEKLKHFQQAVESLGILNSKLLQLVTEHDGWQRLDLDIRRVEVTLEQDILELEMSWPDLRRQAEELFKLSNIREISAFHKNSREIDIAFNIEVYDLPKIREYFHVYCIQTRERFYRVDLVLKRYLCEELREIGGRLDTVLRMIE